MVDRIRLRRKDDRTVGFDDKDYMRAARRGRATAPRGRAIGATDPEFVAARKRFEQRRRRIRWTVTAFAAFFVMLALAIAVALVMRSANAL
jgi:hypothetical protein